MYLRVLAACLARHQQQCLGLSDREKWAYERWANENLHRELRGEPNLPPPDWWVEQSQSLEKAVREEAVGSAPADRPAGSLLAANASPPSKPAKGSTPSKPPTTPRPANAAGVNPDDYAAVSQETIRILGPDWKNVSTGAIKHLRELGQVIDQVTGAVLGHGADALGVEAFVRLKRRDGGVDSAQFHFVSPWFSAPHWEFVRLVQGAAPRAGSGQAGGARKDSPCRRDAHALATARLQGGMFAIIGGASGIVEGAPLLGTLEAASGGEQIALAGVDLATGKENRAWSTRAIQAAFEAAGVDSETASFLAEHGGLMIILGRATVDAAGTAHAVIETTTGYRIRLEFDPATLSANGLGGAKIKAVRIAPDGTEIKQIGGRFPINSKYAGKVMPAEALPVGIRHKYPNGVRFSSDGYPIYDPYAIKTVKVKGLAGNRGIDNRKANAAAHFVETPDGYTWHHHEDGVTMQLVPTDLHDAVKHTGGVATILHGDKPTGENDNAD